MFLNRAKLESEHSGYVFFFQSLRCKAVNIRNLWESYSITKERNILFTFLRVMGLFFRSEPPGLVFSVTYPWGSFPPPHSPPAAELRLPPQISHEKAGGLPPVT
jgi:hypothetical protein